MFADFPTVRKGTIGSLLGDLADRAGGAGGATGGALTGGVTFEVDVGAGLMDAGAALWRIFVGGAGGVFGGVTDDRTGAGGGCGVRAAGSLLLARLAERDLCSPTFLKVSLRKGGTLSFLSRRSALDSSRFSLYFSFKPPQRSLLRSSDCCDLIRMFLRAFS